MKTDAKEVYVVIVRKGGDKIMEEDESQQIHEEDIDPEEFSSTMRIDIPPELLKGGAGAAPPDALPRKRKKTIRITKQQRTPVSKYEQLLQSIYDAALITDLNGNIVDANTRAVEFLHHTREDLCQRNILDIISGAGEEMLQSIIASLDNDRFVLIEAYCQREDESLFPSEISVNQFKFEEVRLCFFLRDITLRKQTEEMLKTSHNAIMNSWNGIAVADLDGRLLFMNPSALRMWGQSQEKQLIGLDVRELWKDANMANEMIETVLGQSRKWEGEMEIEQDDGSTLSVQVSAAGNRDAEDEIVGMVLSFTDLTDRKNAERATQQAEGHRAMLASIGTACHHVGQPATVVITNLKMMQRMSDLLHDDLKGMVEEGCVAADALQEVLEKLNQVAFYVTTEYLESAENQESAANLLIDLE